jgi:predicted enzyme related to lactoylglutathione lyase
MLKIIITSIPVNNQDVALAFYTNILGFVKKTEIPMGPYKWLTVVQPNATDGVELLLEPMAFPPSQTYQQALFNAGIPCTIFGVDDIKTEYERLLALGVVFKTPPTPAGPVTIAVFEDTCGNLLQMVQQ